MLTKKENYSQLEKEQTCFAEPHTWICGSKPWVTTTQV